MADITEARRAMTDFITKELSREESQIKFIKITRTSEGWNGKAEITEDNVHMKKLGYASIFEKNIYVVDLDDALNATNFCREGEEY